MSIDKLAEFAKDGDKNLDNLDVSKGFLQSEKPERQWFNQLFNNITTKTNEVVEGVNALEVNDNLMQAQLDSVEAGRKAYPTYDDMVLNKDNIGENRTAEVTNDPDDSKNGVYLYDGTTFTRAKYDNQEAVKRIIADTAIAVQDAINNTVVSSGFVTIDSFELGATITQRNEALRHTADGKLYRWAGDLPKIVPESSTPANSGGIDANAWLEVSDAVLRQQLAKSGGAALVKGAVISVTTIAEMQSYSVAVGTTFNLTDKVRHGTFEVVAGDFSSELASDTFNALYIGLADDPTATTKVARRLFSGVLSAGWFGVQGDWDEVSQTGTDDTLNLQACIDYSVSNKLPMETGGEYIRTTATIVTNTTEYYAPLNWEALSTKLIADHDGVGLKLLGGSAMQTISGELIVKPSEVYKNTGSPFDPAKHGIWSLNCRHNIKAVVSGFRGAGFTLQSSGGNANSCVHDIRTTSNGRGAWFTGTKDDLSLMQSKIRASSNFEEGIYVDDDTKLRQCTAHWTAENNLLSFVGDTTRYGVYVGMHVGCDFWIYCEQYNGELEIYLADEGGSKVYSARRNRDYIGGTNSAWAGATLYQNTFLHPSIRVNTPLKLHGQGISRTSVNQRLEVPLLGNGGAFGYLRGQMEGIHIDSANRLNSVSVSDKHIKTGQTTKYSGNTELTTAIQEKSIVIYDAGTSTSTISRYPICGRLRVIGSPLKIATGFFTRIYDIDFYLIDGVITISNVTADIDYEDKALTPISLAFVDGRLELTVKYRATYWGDSYKVAYDCDFVGF